MQFQPLKDFLQGCQGDQCPERCIESSLAVIRGSKVLEDVVHELQHDYKVIRIIYGQNMTKTHYTLIALFQQMSMGKGKGKGPKKPAPKRKVHLLQLQYPTSWNLSLFLQLSSSSSEEVEEIGIPQVNVSYQAVLNDIPSSTGKREGAIPEKGIHKGKGKLEYTMSW